ncbi:hypothetical protein BABINDRAFT_164675 [Babjeviella inositovora NRRL Y-12698]|uniref:VPS37 C-terminal domain-containing protein n=1 Tax=Babjeviella inositovora NRRL Y-12698 TaxID=984486 RepID=A0A1E3QZ95_9ASCO|nr:uncharacterized protein BABINDRAFT_164675 [Babjeviella inositovora NRRL Y-12698]ODQ82956.1 hypothetical protein BABINDRAFT_164675 [Babjeviella inositovora NRRL Y-12698]
MSLPPLLPPRPENGPTASPPKTQTQLSPAINPTPFPKYFSSLPRDSLNELRSEPTLLSGYVKTHPSFTKHEAAHVNLIDEQIAELRSLADRLLALRARYQMLNDEALPEFVQHRASWQSLELEMYRNLERFNLNHLKSRMREAIAEANAYSLLMVDAVIEEHQDKDEMKEKDLQQFLRDYKQTRILYHSRKERSNRWAENRVGGAI